MALVLPLLLLMVVGIIEFGTGFYFKNTAIQIARDAVRNAVVTPNLVEANITSYVSGKYGTLYTVQSTAGVPPAHGGSITVTIVRPYSPVLAKLVPGIPNTFDISASATMRYEQ